VADQSTPVILIPTYILKNTMLFQKILPRYLFAFGLQSIALANPVPSNEEDLAPEQLLSELSTEGLVLFTGEPELRTGSEDESAGVNSLEERDEASAALTTDQAAALRLHNTFRAKKNLTALSWDTTLAKNAQVWAKNLTAGGQLVHSTSQQRPGQGENLAYIWSTNTIPNPMYIGTQGWLDEYKKYNNEVIPQGNFAEYGHYSMMSPSPDEPTKLSDRTTPLAQCMWKTTTKVGIATASDGKGAWFTVARYSPPGNYVGQRPY
jgi:hypothetical protein